MKTTHDARPGAGKNRFLENLNAGLAPRMSAMQEELTRTAMRIALVFGGAILVVTALPSVIAAAIAWTVDRAGGPNRFEMWVFSAPIVAIVVGILLLAIFGPKSRRKIAEQERAMTGGPISLEEARRERARRAATSAAYTPDEFEGGFARTPVSDRDAMQAEMIREGIGLAVRFARLVAERREEQRMREEFEQAQAQAEASAGTLREPGEEPRAA